MRDFPGEARVAGTQFSHRYEQSSTTYGYVLSGDGSNHGYIETGEFWEYNPNDDSWRKLKAHPSNSRWAPGSFVIGCNAYLVAGYDRKAKQKLRDIYRYPLVGCPTPKPTRTPTVFPTRRPSRNPTEHPTRKPTTPYPTYQPCGALSRSRCRSRKFKKTCLWQGSTCIERILTGYPTRKPTTPYPTYKPCGTIRKRAFCNNRRNRKSCKWYYGECIER